MGGPSHEFVFYSPGLDRDTGLVELTDDEHHHLSRVLRMATGETAFVSNGRGLIVRCLVDGIDDRVTRLSVAETLEDRTDAPSLVLALAVLKKEATELGATHLQPFVASKSHLNHYAPAYMDRLRRIALSAMKQSFRSMLPVIEPPASFDALIDSVSSYRTVIVGDADAPSMDSQSHPGPAMIVVGPEAGLTPDECARLRGAGATPLSVSPHRLRSETAASALLSRIGQVSQDG
jgi:16S rRNA (uracil1498-N3)-methyltransferase